MVERLIAAHQALQQIYVRGIDVKHMANAMQAIEETISELQEQQEDDE